MMDALRYNLAARGQEQNYALSVLDQNLRTQQAILPK
jgi:hypothetical protein